MSDAVNKFKSLCDSALNAQKFDELPKLDDSWNFSDDEKALVREYLNGKKEQFQKIPAGAIQDVADKGYPDAQAKCARLYEKEGVSEEAKKYYEKLRDNQFKREGQSGEAQEGIEVSDFLIKNDFPRLSNGKITKEEREEGQRLDARMAAQLHTLEQKNPKLAERYYKAAADRGYPSAQIKYADMQYAKGNKKMARAYLKKAKQNPYLTKPQRRELSNAKGTGIGRKMGHLATKSAIKASGMLAKAGILYLSAPYICGALAMTLAFDVALSAAMTDSPSQANFSLTKTAWNMGKGMFGVASGITDSATRGGSWLADQFFKRGSGR